MRILTRFFQDTEYYFTSLDGYPFSIGIVVPDSERQSIKVNSDRLDKTLIKETIMRDVPDRLRWKKYPLCTKNITGQYSYEAVNR